jgi:hypothetical protein
MMIIIIIIIKIIIIIIIITRQTCIQYFTADVTTNEGKERKKK